MNKIEMAGPSITQHEIETVNDAMRNGWYGDTAYYYCELLQKDFAVYHQRHHALMTPNCTSAIHLLLAGLGIGPGDEVIVPECTWIATAAPIKWLGATTVFADIEPDNWCIDPDSVLSLITPQTKAIIAVDLFGNMPYWDDLLQIGQDHNIHIIEDAAEALGSTYNGVKAGKFGVGSVFSFHRTKTMTTGEGGMLLLDDDVLYERCKFLRDHGRHPNRAYYTLEVAYKYMPSNLQAALGYAQFQRLPELINIKRKHFEYYRNNIAERRDSIFHRAKLEINHEPNNVFNAAWISTIVSDLPATQVRLDLEKRGVPTRPFFYPLSSLPAYNEFNKYAECNECAYDISARGFSLPGAMNLDDEQLKFIADTVYDYFQSR